MDLKDFAKLIDSRQVFILIDTIELDWASEAILKMAEWYTENELPKREADLELQKNGLSVSEWIYGKGWNSAGSMEKDYFSMLRSIKNRKYEILIIRNFGYAFDTQNIPQLIETMLDLYYYCEKNMVYIFFVGRKGRIPVELMPYFTSVEFKLPDENELKELVIKIAKREDISYTQSMVNTCALAVKGLTKIEAERAINIAILYGNKKNPVNFDKLYTQKADLVRKSGILEYVRTSETESSLGGMDLLKEHYRIMSVFYKNRDKAVKFGLVPPKGCLLVGVQGCGKSLCAKVVSEMFGLPLYRWDIGMVYGSLVGETEERTRMALKLIKAISPAVILIDEAEKMFAGYQSSAETSSGVVNRVLGEILYFMEEENEDGAFFFFTSNSMDDLPPELVRAGRLDDIWFVDLPTQKEREEIFKIHINLKKRDAKKYDTLLFASTTEGYTGADIENIINKAMFYSFIKNEELSNDNILKAISEVTPFSVTHKNTIEKLREWAKLRAKPVSSTKLTEKETKLIRRKP